MRKSLFSWVLWGTVLFGIALNVVPVPAFAQAPLNPRLQPQFVNQLPIPSVIDARNGGLFTLGITQFDQWLGLVDPNTQQPLKTKVWGYNGSYPGPTILAKKNVPVEIFWRNNLVDGNDKPLPHLLPVDPTVHWALGQYGNWQNYGVPVVTHLHGGHTESASDGLPEAWFTPEFTLKGPEFIKGDILPYRYNNSQEAATLWYHDHALGITRLNVYAGLAGYYLLTDDNELSLQQTHKLPASPYDMGFVIQDRMFTANGELYYPATSQEETPQPYPSVLPEFFGDFILVNGTTWPVLDVEPRQYRFRVLNGSDSRFYNLFLSSNQLIQQIGSDDGLLPLPVPFSKLLIGPGERKDVIIDFSDPVLWNQTIIMQNDAKTPYPKGRPVDPKTTGRIMAFRVTKPLNPGYPITEIPATLRPQLTPLQTTLPPRRLILFESEDEFGRLKPMLGTLDKGVMEWDNPVTENPGLNSTEIWEIYNLTPDAHPIHLHLVSMQLINRQKFFAKSKEEEDSPPTSVQLAGVAKGPEPDERGWKDTWVMYPGEVTRVVARFDLPGRYVWHCHILSHEDHEMMRPFFVGSMNSRPGQRIADQPSLLEDLLQLQATPNPFSTRLTIRFQLPAPSAVALNLYDESGRAVRKTTPRTLVSGAQQIELDGSHLANGVYYCELVIDGKKMFKKIALQKMK